MDITTNDVTLDETAINNSIADISNEDDVRQAIKQLAKIRYVQDTAGVNFHIAVWALGFIPDYPIVADLHY